jgi:hypothetical protein
MAYDDLVRVPWARPATETERGRPSGAIAALMLGSSLLLGMSNQVLAADRAGNFSIRGLGAQPCGQVEAAREAGDDIYPVFRGWVNGYVTNVNATRDGIYDASGGLGIDTLMTLIGNVCRNQGDQSLIQSLQDVLTILKPAALSARPEPVELTTGDRTMSLPRETLEFVQSELAELGFYTSVVDGLYGPGTRRAIEGFQRDRGLEVTGLPNDGLIVRLAFSAGRSG